MMKVRVEDDGKAPIYRLIKPLCQSLVMIAPERAEQIRDPIDDLTLVILDKDRFVCEVRPIARVMNVSRRTLEIIWATSYAYFTYYVEVFSGKRITTHTVVDFTSDPLLRDAMALLRWSLKPMNPGRWPEELPAPEETPEPASNAHVANEVAACVAAFFLHHELAHIRLRHERTEDNVLSIEQERDADHEAANWILAKVPTEEGFDRRAFGLTVGLMILVGRGIHYGDQDGETHPRTFDRLFNTLERHVSDPGHTAWAFAMAVLKLHLDNSKIVVPEIVYASPKAAVNAYVEALAAEEPR
jgi:Peptidase U49